MDDISKSNLAHHADGPINYIIMNQKDNKFSKDWIERFELLLD